MIAVAQLDLVGVAIAINDSILIQGGIVGHKDSGTLSESADVGFRKHQSEAVGGRGEGIIGGHSIIGGNLEGTVVEGQALAHGIGDGVLLSTVSNLDLDLILHSITDLGVVFAAPITGACLNFLLDFRFFVLFLDGGIGIGGIQTAQSTQRAVHQVVAQVQVREGDGATSCGFLSARDLLISCPGQSCLSKCGNSGGIVFVSSRPSGVVLAVQGDVVSTGTRLEETLPIRFYGVGIGIAFSVVAVQLEHAVDGVGLVLHRFADGDGTFGGIGHCKSRHGHSQHQRCCQQGSKQFFERLFHEGMIRSFPDWGNLCTQHCFGGGTHSPAPQARSQKTARRFSGQMRRNTRPTTWLFSTQPITLLRLSMDTERWSPSTKYRFSGT